MARTLFDPDLQVASLMAGSIGGHDAERFGATLKRADTASEQRELTVDSQIMTREAEAFHQRTSVAADVECIDFVDSLIDSA